MHTTPPTDPSTHGRVAVRRKELGVTTSSPLAESLYRDAIERVQGAEAGAPELLDEAIALDPSFAVAHAARWMLARADGDTRASRSSRDAVRALRVEVTGWELGHIDCLALLIERAPEAAARSHEHLAEHPRDLLVAAQLMGELFFHGGAGRRAEVLDLLRELKPHHEDDWAFTARLGFHTSEAGDPRAALDILAPALRARPHAPFVSHAMAHALLDAGERAESHRFLQEWVAQNDPTGPLDGHLHWHLSLGELERAEPTAALERFRRHSIPGVSHGAQGLVLADAAGLLFRLVLAGARIDDVPRDLLQALLLRLTRALDSSFVATHAAALWAAFGDRAGLDGCLQAMERLAPDRRSEAAYRVVSAFAAWAAGDMRACVAALERDRPSSWEAVGGSNEERALLAQLHAHASARLVDPPAVSTADPTRAPTLDLHSAGVGIEADLSATPRSTS